MSDPRRLCILEWARTRVELITVEHGYQTDLGKYALLGEVPTFGPGDPVQVIAILPREDQVAPQQVGKLAIVLPIDFAVIVKADVDEPWRLVELGLADLKRAIEVPTNTDLLTLLSPGRDNPVGLQRGTTEPFERKSGSEFVGASITWGFKYAETIGQPDA